MTLSQSDLQEIKDRLIKTTDGDWKFHENSYDVSAFRKMGATHVAYVPSGKGNTAFIAHSKQDIERLLAEVERLNQEICATCSIYKIKNERLQQENQSLKENVNGLGCQLSVQSQENQRYRAALEKINMGRHGELTATVMALIAFEALDTEGGKG